MGSAYPNVTVYTRDDCQACKMTKIYLLKNGVPFLENDITRSGFLADALKEQGYRELPVVEWSVDGEIGSWSGFKSEEIEALGHLIEGDR